MCIEYIHFFLSLFFWRFDVATFDNKALIRQLNNLCNGVQLTTVRSSRTRLVDNLVKNFVSWPGKGFPTVKFLHIQKDSW